MLRLLRALALVVTLPIALAACSKKPGDSCQIGSRACMDKQTMLVCDTGKYAVQACAGANGCVEPPYTAPPICDTSGNKAGDRCFDARDANVRCTTDEKAKISCYKEHFVIEPCRGPGGCMQLDNGVRCNRFQAIEGDACHSDEGLLACAVDGKAALQCKDGKYSVIRKCDSCEIDVTQNNLVVCR
ncbi:MAG: hypothetical protein QM820_28710 [Minicystis sp.]